MKLPPAERQPATGSLAQMVAEMRQELAQGMREVATRQEQLQDELKALQGANGRGL